MALATGSRLGPYEITGAVGAGGMGVVYAAKDTRLGRTVALKTLSEDFKSHAGRLQRLEQEARAVAALNHPNILAVYDVGEHEGVPFVVTELLEGASLREVLDRGALPWRKALDYAAQMAQGLAAAHDKGIIHRDLKPENIFITRDGRAKLLDFGLARSDGPQGRTSTLAQTDSGAVLGTAGYMSPEQVRGQPADSRSDIFSFGAVLYEMLAGTRAFEGTSGVERGYAVLNADPPEPTQPIPQSVERLTRRCLEKSPEQRFQSARDLAFSIETLGGSSAETRGGSAPRSSTPRWQLIAVALLSALAAGVGLRSMQPTPTTVPQKASAAPALATHFRRLTTDGAEWPALAPDGTWFVYSRKVGGTYHLFRQRVGGENAVDLTPKATADEVAASISPDGNQIAWQSSGTDGGLFVMGATGESARRLTSHGDEPSWSPDGRRLVFSNFFIRNPSVRAGRHTRLAVVDVATGAVSAFLDDAVDRTQPVWSPDGRSLAYHSGIRPGWRTVTIEDLDGGGRQVVTPGGIAWTPRWAPDGGALYFASAQSGAMNLWRVIIGPAGLVGAQAPVTAGAGLGAHHPTFSRDGRQVLFAASRRSSNIFRVRWDARAMRLTAPPVPVTQGAHSFWGPDISPDGQWVAFAEGLTGGQEDIFIARPDGSERRRLTDDPAWDRLPRFTSDSRRLIFYSNRGGAEHGHAIWSIAVDGSDLRRLTELGRREGRLPIGQATWAIPSPTDSRVVARVWLKPGQDTGVVFDAEKPIAQQATLEMGGREDEAHPDTVAWTQDGAEILSNSETGKGVFAWSPATGKHRQLTLHNLTPFDLRDGRLLGQLADGRLVVVALATQQLETLPATNAGPEDSTTPVTVSRDGGWLYFTQTETESDAWLADLP